MLFYYFDMLDDFIKNNLIGNLKKEKETIEEIIDLYHNKKANLLSITTNMIEVADLMEKGNLDSFYNTVSLLKKSFESIDAIQLLASKLKQDLAETISLYDKSVENNKNEIKANLVEYNKQREELFDKILKFEKTNTTLLNSAIELSLNGSNRKLKKQNRWMDTTSIKPKVKVDIELEPYDNNVLIISEKEQKAYLPFLYSEVDKIYKHSHQKYQTLQDVVNDLYVVPLSKFKNSAVARFKESFRLIREREKGSITKALDLGLELMFNYQLNPIVVAACRNLDELDIYLDCLEENELYDFTCFEIKFEMMPTRIRNNKKTKNTFLD